MHSKAQQILANLNGPMTAEQARAIFALGEEAVVFALLKLSSLQTVSPASTTGALGPHDPSCPSGQKPPFVKDNLSDKRRKKLKGRKAGHPGVRRPAPDRVDRTEAHRADCCPDCGGHLKRCAETRERLIEDLPASTRIEVVRHIIHRDWCSNCRKMVEPVIDAALPRATVGNGMLVLCAWLHFALGNTISQILAVFNYHLQFKMSGGGLVQMWHRLATILEAWYDEILADIQKVGALFADETGWRMDGKTHWLWCFTSATATIFTIEQSRAGPVVLAFIKEWFDGVLVSDFWYAYHVLDCAKQKCLVHLLRELERVKKYKNCDSDWPRFGKSLKRLLRDAIRLSKRQADLEPAIYQRRCALIEKRLQAILDHAWSHPDAKRLIKRLKRHQAELFTFLYHPEVPFDNNFGERSIRGAVIMRKNSYNNRSPRGARIQSILMSVFYTLKQRGLNPVAAVKKALQIYLQTGKLPTLAQLPASLG